MKMVLVINVKDDEDINADGMQFAFNESFKDIAEIDSIYESFYSNEEPLTLTAAAVSQDVEGKFSGELTNKEMVKITNFIADSESLSQYIDDEMDYAREDILGA